jgi:hypothetical protein
MSHNAKGTTMIKNSKISKTFQYMTCKFCVSSLLQRDELLNLVEPNNKVLKEKAQSNHHLIHEKRNNATHYKDHKCNNKVVDFKDHMHEEVKKELNGKTMKLIEALFITSKFNPFKH